MRKWSDLAHLDFQDAERHLIRVLLTWRKPPGWSAYRAERRLWQPAGATWRGWTYLAVASPDAGVTEEGEAEGDGTDVMRLVVVKATDVAGLPEEPVVIEEAMRGRLHRQ